MKIQVLAMIFCIFCSFFAFGESETEAAPEGAENPENGPGFYNGAFIGLGGEMNLNTRRGFSAGPCISGGFEFREHFALGLKANYSTNFDTVNTLESSLLFRYYMPLNDVFSGVFAELNAGLTAFFEYGDMYVAPLAALGAGWRFKFLKRWYAEAMLRGGIPFTWGFGVSAGIIL